MLFNSLDFAIFLPIVFLLYWFVVNKSLKAQNFLLLVVSYVFYGWWDWRFLSLIIFSSLVDYLVCIQIGQQSAPNKRKLLLWVSILVNLGFLGFFKYFNFFAESLVNAFATIGYEMEVSRLNLILPVGISFYTFQTLSYTIDVYKEKLTPTKDALSFFAYVAFFPQLVAGPIERAKHLLPQFYVQRRFDYGLAVDGLRQMLWGFFKKIVIADGCADLVNQIFSGSDQYGAGILMLGAVFFAFQIYGDFSGYSDIAIGTARLFGFDLMQNFAFPYFSRSISEFWRRWHISLSTWFRDYLYIPLGGSRGNQWIKIRNVFVIFLVSGFWHGANWTFLFWGFLNALYFLPEMLMKNNRVHLDVVAQGRMLPSVKELIQVLITFFITCLAWISFRAESMAEAFAYYKAIFTWQDGELPMPSTGAITYLLVGFMLIEWSMRNKKHAMVFAETLRPGLRWLLYIGMVLFIYLFGNFSTAYEFIYFQF